MNRDDMKRYFAEGIGTFFIILFGLCSFIYGLNDFIVIGLVFGVGVMAAYVLLHNVSGAHMNPSITVAMLIEGKIKAVDSILYIVSQLIGAILSVLVFKLIVNSLNLTAPLVVTNGFDINSPLRAGLLVALFFEATLTFVFTLIYLAASDKLKPERAGMVVGLTFAMATVTAMPFTLAGLNPAKSLATALFEGGAPLEQVWVFIFAPIIGAIAAALLYGNVISRKETALPESQAGESSQDESSSEIEKDV